MLLSSQQSCHLHIVVAVVLDLNLNCHLHIVVAVVLDLNLNQSCP